VFLRGCGFLHNFALFLKELSMTQSDTNAPGKTPAKTAAKTTKRRPKVVINADDLAHLDGLAEGMMRRNPDLADILFEELGRARIVPPAKMPQNVVTMGSTVTYRDETSGQEKSVTLVYPEQADIARMRVSVMTPIGVALLGLSEGASFSWDTRDNQRRILTILTVTQPAAVQSTDS
jgi:regulator of nucleoside diphosphate kinase